nr:alpha/beta hydrolase-fold protein [Streptomyces sp. SID14515]
MERLYGAGVRRVAAGESQGGFGALAYAARHPGLFRPAARPRGVGLHALLPGRPLPAVLGAGVAQQRAAVGAAQPRATRTMRAAQADATTEPANPRADPRPRAPAPAAPP